MSDPKTTRETHHMPHCLCPECGYHVTAAGTQTKGGRSRRPANGDFSTCLACGAVLQFNAFGILTRCDPAALRAFQIEEPEAYRRLQQSKEFVRSQKEWAPRDQRGGQA